MPADKTRLRKEARAIRAKIPLKQAQQAANTVRDYFFQQLNPSKDAIISAYYPIHNEISPLPLLEACVKQHITTSLPYIEALKKPLLFKQWQPGEPLVTSPMLAIKEPTPQAKQVTPTIMVIPLLGFDEDGHRLGYGQGCYDRTMHFYHHGGHKVIEVGIAYECQKLEKLPVDAHDESMDYIITEQKIRTFSE